MKKIASNYDDDDGMDWFREKAAFEAMRRGGAVMLEYKDGEVTIKDLPATPEKEKRPWWKRIFRMRP